MEKPQEAVLLTKAEWDRAYVLANMLARLDPENRELLCAVALDLAEQADKRG